LQDTFISYSFLFEKALFLFADSAPLRANKSFSQRRRERKENKLSDMRN